MSRLAGNPPHAPLLSQKIVLRNGNILEVVDPLATRALIALMDMQAVLGGAASHYGGPSAFAELMSAAWGYMFYQANLQKRPWHQLYHFVNDAGHCENGLYALKALYGHAGVTIAELKHFRSLESRLTGHGESHVFPEGVLISNGPLGSALPQSQGLAMADCAKKNSRLTLATVSDGGLMEGEAREALAAIPGLAQSGKVNPFVMIISDNNTKLSGRIDRDAFSMKPTFMALEVLGWKVLNLENGHDLQACLTTIEAACEMTQANPKQPVAIHARTIKGYGVSACVESATGGHGFPLKDPKDLRAFIEQIYQGQAIPDLFLPWLQELEAEGQKRAQTPKSSNPVVKEKIQVGVAKALMKLKQQGLPIVSITSDLPGSTGVADFQKKFPESTFDVGVAEANMISVAAGFSKEGFIPIVDTFAQFGVTKGALPLTMAVLSQASVVAFFSHTGFQDAADGASHQALSYLAQVGSIPHTEVYALTCSQEAEALVTQAIQRLHDAQKRGEAGANIIFFLGREDFQQEYQPQAIYSLGRAQTVFEPPASVAPEVVIVAAGSMVPDAIRAGEQLAKEDLGAIVINASALNKPDVATIKRALEKAGGRLLTVEDHQVAGGLSSFLLPPLLEQGTKVAKFAAIGVRNHFGRSAYKASDLYKKYGMDADAISQACRKLIEVV